MPTLETLTIAQQATSLLSNVRRDIRASATAHKARLDANQWTADFTASEVNKQGVALQTVLQRIVDNKSIVESSLVDWGVSVPDTTADYQQLKDAADAMATASAANVLNRLNTILAGVPAKQRLY